LVRILYPPEGGVAVLPYTKRWKWLQSATGQQSLTAVARNLGVTHQTVQRWTKARIPVDVLMDIVVKHGCDPVEALTVWGYLSEEALPELNWRSVVRYIPGDVLTGEVHRRTVEWLSVNTDQHVRQNVGLLRRA
jgi:hypothetical protein